jgi:hypothetical protein
MELDFADEITRLGDHYWRIIDPIQGKSLTPPIWARPGSPGLRQLTWPKALSGPTMLVFASI